MMKGMQRPKNLSKADKIKEVLILILFTLNFLLFCTMFVIRVKMNYSVGEEIDIQKKILLSFAILWLITGISIIFIGSYNPKKKKGIYGPSKTTPKEYKINRIESILDFFINGFKENNFIKKIYKNNEYKVTCYIKENKENVIINMIIKMEEMTERIYKDFEENYFEKIGNKLLEDNIVNPKKQFYITIFMQVEKNNELFQEMISENISQGAGRYVVPIGIDLSSKKLYIATQQDGFGQGSYNYMKKNIIKEIEEFIKLP